MTVARKLLATLLVLSLLAALAGAGTVSSFTSNSSNDANTWAAGTVSISDNDGGAALYTLSGLEPGSTTERCIKVTYGGTLDGDVRLYTDSSLGTLAPYLNLTITPGSQTGSPPFGDCSNFTPDAGGAIFTGTLGSFGSSHSNWATGLVDAGTGTGGVWPSGSTAVYRLSLSVQDNDAAANKTTGSHRFVIEARNR